MSIKHSAPVVIYGPEGCGKTLNAPYLAKLYDKQNVVEADHVPVNPGISYSHRKLTFGPGMRPDTLYLVSQDRYRVLDGTFAVFISFETALNELRVADASGK